MGFFSLLKSIFTSQSGQEADTQPESAVEYLGFTIVPIPKQEGGQYRVEALIQKAGREHRFIRSDMLMSKADCIDITLRKAKTLIDEQGEAIFDRH